MPSNEPKMMAVITCKAANSNRSCIVHHGVHTRSYRQEGLVDGVNVNIIDLVDAHNISIATQQSQHTEQSPWQQAPVNELHSRQQYELASSSDLAFAEGFTSDKLRFMLPWPC